MRRPLHAVLSLACLLVLLPTAARAGHPDSLQASSARLDSLEAAMARNWFTRSLARYVFEQSSRPLEQQAVVALNDSRFAAYQGRYIRAITVDRLDVFASYDPESGDPVQTTLERLGGALHVDTRESVMRRYFLMAEGDRLDPDAITDTERLLRATPFIHDARIVVLPAIGSIDSVDVVVVTQDRWTLGVDLKIKSVSSYNLRVADRNFAGWGHVFENELLIDTELSQQVGYAGTYRMDNIRGSFVRNTLQFRNTDRETRAQFDLSREREAPQIRTIGALAASANRLASRGPDNPEESSFATNVWLGRAVGTSPGPFGSPGRSAVVVAGAWNAIDFDGRPDSVTADFNRRYHDRHQLLSSVSFTRSNYRKARLVFGYGQTEDVPYGVLAAVTGGAEIGEFDTRAYAATEVRGANYTRWGHFSGAAAVGAFVGEKSWEDGVIDLSGGWFSGLLVQGGFGLRQFVRASYTYGFERREADQIPLDDAAGLVGLRDSQLLDRQRLVANLESVAFTPWTAFGFRFAFFGTLNVGTLGPDPTSFLDSKYYSTVGIGMRFHNERLILDPLELRISFSIARPEGSTIENIDFGNIDTRRFLGLDPSRPAIVPYR